MSREVDRHAWPSREQDLDSREFELDERQALLAAEAERVAQERLEVAEQQEALACERNEILRERRRLDRARAVLDDARATREEIAPGLPPGDRDEGVAELTTAVGAARSRAGSRRSDERETWSRFTGHLVHAAKYRVAPEVTGLRGTAALYARSHTTGLLVVGAIGVLLAWVAVTVWSSSAKEPDPGEPVAAAPAVRELELELEAEPDERLVVVPDDPLEKREELEPEIADRPATRAKRVRRRSEPGGRPATARTSALRGGKLGVKVRPVDAGLAEAAGIMAVTGAYVTSVVAGGAADRSGVRPGDIILSIGGRTLKHARALAPLVSRIDTGRPTKLVLWRERRAVIVAVTLSP